jgi:hypothetical protein
MKHTGRASVDILFHTVLAEVSEQEADWQSSYVEHVAYGRAPVKNM